jgi:hypothetical protein
MAALDESALLAEIQKLDAEGREAERKIKELEFKEKNADGTFRGYVTGYTIKSCSCITCKLIFHLLFYSKLHTTITYFAAIKYKCIIIIIIYVS